MKTKSIFSCLLLLWVSITTYAYDACIDGIYYNLSGTTASVTYETTSYNSYSGIIDIPNSIEYDGINYSVTKISDDAFRNCTGLISVTIPNSVTSIGNDAFSGCSGLTKAEFASIESLCNISFTGDDANPLHYAHHLYIDGIEIKNLTIPNSVTSIDSYAFSGCSGLTSVTIPESVTSIGSSAFKYCSGLTSVTIPESVTSIGYEVFYGCSGLTSVTIPESVTSIGNYAFSDCRGLTSVTIPESVTSIGEYAFGGCRGLTSVTIPESVTSIRKYAFSDCSGLTSVVSEIETPFTFGSSAFSHISSSCTLTVPSGTRETYINKGWTTSIFRGGIIDLSDPSAIYVEAGCCFHGNTIEGIDMTFRILDATLNTVQVGDNSCSIKSGTTGTVTIPDKVVFGGKEYSVTSIGETAFRNCSGLTSVTIPNGVTSIGNSAFDNCSGLTSVTIPNSVTSIGNSAFDNCSGLTSVTIPNGVTSIGNSAFYNCSGLTSVTIPNSVTAIDDWAFGHCSGLTSVTIPNSVTSIGSSAFYGCSGLTSVTIPNSVTSIGNSAFYNCSGLTSVTIPNSVTAIDDWAFGHCSGLTSVTIPNSVTSIGNSAFYNCSGLTSVTIPESVTSIGNYAFSGCSGLTSVTIPESVTSIGDNTFSGCSSLTSVTIPESVTSIGNYAFRNCSGLTSVVSEIETPFTFGSSAFSYISSSCTLTVPSGTREAYINKGWTTSIFRGGIIDLSEPSAIYVEAGCCFHGNTIEGIDMTFRILDATLNTVQVGDNSRSIKSGTTGAVTIPDKVVYGGKEYSVTSIGNSAFKYCSGLTSVTIPESVTSIGYEAFYQCSGLTSVTIPESVTSIGDYAFRNCSGLTSVVSEIETPFTFGSSAFSYISSSCTLTVPSGTRETYINKGWTTSIFRGGIIDLSDPSAIYLATGDFFTSKTTEGLDISFKVMDNAQNIVQALSRSSYSPAIDRNVAGTVTIPYKVAYGGKEYSVTSIGGWAFYNCSGLTSVTIPNSVTSIYSYAFSGCSSLTSVKVDIVSPLPIISSTFSNRANATLYVPAGYKAAYEEADYWKEFKRIVEFIEGDVNGDGETDVLDVVDIARFVVGTPAETFVQILADMNSDGQVNIGDAVTLVNEIAGDQNFVKPMMAPRKVTTDEESLTLTESNNGLSLALENHHSYTAFQFDLYVPECADVTTMMLNAQRKQKHQLLYNKVENGHWRVTAFSTSNRSFQGNDGELFSFALDTEGDIALRNIQFFDAEGNGYQFDDICQSGVTGVETIHDSQFTIHNSDIYDIQGRRHTKLQRGLNIVNGKKVFVK